MCGLLLAQATMGGNTPSNAAITFTLDFPGSTPPHYSITVAADGNATYGCNVRIEDDADEQTYKIEFVMSPANRERIFNWAKQAQYFAGKIDSGKRNLAFTGAKVLSYRDGQRSFQAQYNYSSLEAVQQLTALFQNVAGTLDYGRRLAYYHRYQKLALDDELKRMEAEARNNQLSEIQSVAPVLQEIVEDTSVMNLVRVRAKELLEMKK
jgi:aminopeptidase N